MQVLWFAHLCVLSHTLYLLKSSSFPPPHPRSLQFLHPPPIPHSCTLSIELPFLPPLNVCIHFHYQIQKTMAYSSGPGQQNDLYFLLYPAFSFIPSLHSSLAYRFGVWSSFFFLILVNILLPFKSHSSTTLTPKKWGWCVKPKLKQNGLVWKLWFTVLSEPMW